MRALGLVGLARGGPKPGVLARTPAILAPSRGALESREWWNLLAGGSAAAYGLGAAGFGGVVHGR